MPRKNGFSAIELLITLLIVAILTAMASPGFSGLMDELRTKRGIQALRHSLALARSEAIKRRTHVSLLNINGRWEEGWQIFADLDANGSFDEDEPLLLQQPPIGDFPIFGNAPVRRLISYQGDGRSVQTSGAFLAGTIFFCPDGANSKAYKLVVARGGRVRTEKLPPKNEYCSLDKSPLKAPSS